MKFLSQYKSKDYKTTLQKITQATPGVTPKYVLMRILNPITSRFKPTPSIFLAQPTQNLNGEAVVCELRGRHDPCIGVRGSVVATAMVRLVTADIMLLNLSANLENLKKIYG